MEIDHLFWATVTTTAIFSSLLMVGGGIFMVSRRSIAEALTGFGIFSVGTTILTVMAVLVYDRLVLF